MQKSAPSGLAISTPFMIHPTPDSIDLDTILESLRVNRGTQNKNSNYRAEELESLHDTKPLSLSDDSYNRKAPLTQPW